MRPSRSLSLLFATSLFLGAHLPSSSASPAVDEASVVYIAALLAAESGGHPIHYLHYAQNLALILTNLTTEEQEEVVGFVPPIANVSTPSGPAANNASQNSEVVRAKVREKLPAHVQEKWDKWFGAAES